MRLRLVAGSVVALISLASCGGGGGGSGDSAGTGPFGIDARPANLTCLAPDRLGGNGTVTTSDAFPAAPSFDQPTKILQSPGDPFRWFVLEKTGRVRVFDSRNPAAASTWLNLSALVNASGEGGLLGLAFHPDFPATREVFVSYTGNPGGPMVSRVSRILLDNTSAPSVTTEQVLLTVDQPFENHNGGDIDFGPDGYLYLGLGDGGSGNDPFNYSQDNTRLLGKMLRIDVAGVAWPAPAYRIPGNNPFAANPKCGPAANGASCPEIYATGLRNPWRWSFDRPTGQLWLGDVGQGSREEVDRIERGGNYGWSCREGRIAGPAGCNPAGVIEPLGDYSHASGDISITGGFVYRGNNLAALRGRYVFGDFV
ncbi:MAG: PQQ-dependent sugar dehydrogenase, partial [Gammaproteobacteria bacterium]